MSTNILHEIFNDVKTKSFTSFTDKVYMDEENVYMLAKQNEYVDKDDYFGRYDSHHRYDFDVVNFFHLNVINRKTLHEGTANSTFICLGGIGEKPLIFRRRFKEHFNSIVSLNSTKLWLHTEEWSKSCKKNKNFIFHKGNTYVKEFPIHKSCSLFLYVRANDGDISKTPIPYINNFNIEAYIKAFNYEMSLWNNGEVNELKDVCPEFVKTYNAFFKPIEKLTSEEKKLIKPLMQKAEFDKRINPLYDKNDIVVKCKKFATIESIDYDFCPSTELISTNGDCENDKDLSALISEYVHSIRTYNNTKDLVGSKFKSPIKVKELEVFFSTDEPNCTEIFKSTKYGMINIENYDRVYANNYKNMVKQYLETIARISNISKKEVIGGLK